MTTLKTPFLALTLFLNFCGYSLGQFVPLPAGSVPLNGPNPGIKVQITRKGLDYFRDFTTESLNHNLRQLKIKEWRVSANTLGIPGNDLAVMRNAAVTSYVPPTRTALQPTRPNKLFWVLNGIGMGTVGEFDLYAAQDRSDIPAIHANFQASLQGLNMQITVTILRSAENTVQLKVDGCKSEITGAVQVRLHDRDPAITETLEIMGPLIEAEFRKVFSRQLCEIGTKFVETELSNLMGDYTSNLSFGEQLKFPSEKERFLSFIFPWKEVDNFIIDSNLVGNPIVTQQFIETHHNGRIYHKTDRPEFHPLNIRPKPMPLMPFQSTKMLQIQISDYSINSFMKSSHGHNLLKADITPKSHPKLAEFLKIRCPRSGRCIGKVLPVISQRYKASKAVEATVRTTRAPVFDFQEDGFVAFVLHGALVLKAKLGAGNNVRENFLAANFAIRCRASVAYVRQKIRGKVRIDGLNLEVRQSIINVDEQAKRKLIDLSKSVFEELLNEDLANGVPLPLLDEVSLHSSELRVQKGNILFTTDIKLDETTTRNLVAAAIQRHFGSPA